MHDAPPIRAGHGHGHQRAIASHVPAAEDGGRTEAAFEPRRRGGQPGNRNALKHGRRTRAAVLSRRLTRARLKVVAHVLALHGLLARDGTRTRPRAVRPDQLALLRALDPEAAAWVERLGLDRRPPDRAR